jgi:hypothetical protein
MEALKETCFLDTIYELRTHGELILYTALPPVKEVETELVKDFLELEYSNEMLEYPGEPPAFDAGAALWGAKLLYVASQLLLYRKQEEADLPALLPVYEGVPDVAAIMSADLCLRLMPDVLQKIQQINPEDPLLPLLLDRLRLFHYTVAAYPLAYETLDWAPVLGNDGYRRCYLNRIIGYKILPLALLPQWQPDVKAALGDYTVLFWKDFASGILKNETNEHD